MGARMRGSAGMVVAAAMMLAAVPTASAGTYDVVSCGAPGAGGVNRAWRAEAGGFQTESVNIPPDPASYEIADQCPSQLLVRSAPADGNAPFLTSGNWVFDAPSGTRLTRLETWRFGVRLRTSADDPQPGQSGDQGDPWRVWTRDEGAQIVGGVFGENCSAPPGAIGCSFGSDSGVGAASRAVYGINVGRISYAVSCEELTGCPRAYSGTPIATIKLFGTRVTVTDTTPPALKAGGPLLFSGWRKPSDRLTYDASDSTGVRSVRLDIGGQSRRVASSCDYHLPAPCPARRAAALTVPPGTPDGILDARVVADDAAGNPTVARRTIRLDGTAPTAVLERARGRSIVISLTDASSGVVGATLEVRKNSKEPYRTLKATVENGRLTAKLDRGSASRIDMRVTVRDAAGNVTQGNPTRLSATSAKIGRRFRKVRSGLLTVPFGRVARLRGRLTLSAGQSFAGQTIVATAAVRRGGARPVPAGSAVTDRRGRYSLRVPAGPSRTYRLVFNGAGGALGVARGVSVRVPASSTIRASRTRVSGRTRVRFSGRLRNRGQRIPGRGLVLVLQGREDGRWRTFEDTRTNGKGRWNASYTFSGRPGSYPIRVRIRRQSNYPFELGHSRALTVRVG